jgi:sulfite exporter TauE/SafE
MQAFLLGISNGATCIAYCAPVLIPFLFGEGRGVLSNGFVILQFLTGRLIGYLAFGVIAWGVGQSILQPSVFREFAIGSAYIVLAVLLIVYGFVKIPAGRDRSSGAEDSSVGHEFREAPCAKADKACPAESISGRFQKIKTWRPFVLPVLIGLATGLNFCPPFLLAFAGAIDQGGLLASLTFFFFFFFRNVRVLYSLPFYRGSATL